MSLDTLYLLAADTILIVHVMFVAFVVLGLVAIYAGRFLSWSWVRNLWFRLAHLAAIVVVVLQAWAGMLCPLTVWETSLRRLAGGNAYEGSFIQHWLQKLLYYDAPWAVFVIAYTLFGVIVIASWFVVPPRRHRNPP